MTSCEYKGAREECREAESMRVSDGIEFIGGFEFEGFTALETVTFGPDSKTTEIQSRAFYGCTNLHTVTLPQTLEIIRSSAFACTGLKSIHLPGALRLIGESAFQSCSSLASVTYDPEIQVSSIGLYTFLNDKLKNFTIWASCQKFASSAFSCSTFESYFVDPGNSVYSAVDGILYEGTTLISCPECKSGNFVLPKTCTAIGGAAFHYAHIQSFSCESPSSLSTIGGNCFIASLLESFLLPNDTKVTSFPAGLFHSCRHLKEVTIPNRVTSLGEFPFYYSTVEKINIAPDHPKWKLLDGILYTHDETQIVTCPPGKTGTYIIPKNVTVIAKTAFFSSAMTSISFEEGSKLKVLGKSAFEGSHLKEFNFDPLCQVTQIPSNAFAASLSLTKISLPKGLQSVDGTAFTSTKVSAFEIPSDAESMKSIEGVLYSKDGKTLYRFPPVKSGDYRVPKDVETIATSAFETCSAITDLKFDPNSRLEKIQYAAFRSSSLTSIEFGENSYSVAFDANCFSGSKIRAVKLPGKMRDIKASLFANCENLISIELPGTTASVGANAFYNCRSLSNLVIPMFCELTSIPESAFIGCHSLKKIELPFLMKSLTNRTLPTGIEEVTVWYGSPETLKDLLLSLKSLKRIRILCDATFDVQSFEDRNISITRICFTPDIPISFFKILIRMLLLNMWLLSKML